MCDRIIFHVQSSVSGIVLEEPSTGNDSPDSLSDTCSMFKSEPSPFSSKPVVHNEEEVIVRLFVRLCICPSDQFQPCVRPSIRPVSTMCPSVSQTSFDHVSVCQSDLFRPCVCPSVSPVSSMCLSVSQTCFVHVSVHQTCFVHVSVRQ